MRPKEFIYLILKAKYAEKKYKIIIGVTKKMKKALTCTLEPVTKMHAMAEKRIKSRKRLTFMKQSVFISSNVTSGFFLVTRNKLFSTDKSNNNNNVKFKPADGFEFDKLGEVHNDALVYVGNNSDLLNLTQQERFEHCILMKMIIATPAVYQRVLATSNKWTWEQINK